MKAIDIIILSFAKTDKHYQLTVNCLNSLIASKHSEWFNIVVIESEPNADYTQFNNVVTVKLTEPFNYNKYANYGASLTDNEFIGVFNNDVVFNENWFHEILKNWNNESFYSCSPISLTSQSQKEFFNIKQPIEGYGIAKELSGWAIVLTRKLHKHLNGFDTCCTFWCSDDVYAEQLKAANIKHYLIPTSIVNHVENGSNTLKTMSSEINNELTFEQAKIFNKKFNANKFNLNKPS